MNLRVLFASSTSILVAVACSGASGTDLFGSPDSSTLETTPPAASGESVPSPPGSSGATDGAPKDPPPTSDGSTSGGSSSGGNDSGADGTAPITGTIYCGAEAAPCAAQAQVCCQYWSGQGTSQTSCQDSGFVTCVGGRTIACDDRTDCGPDQVCCGRFERGSFDQITCRSACNVGGRGVRFCDPKASVDECEEIGRHCAESDALPGYFVCKL